MSFRVLSATDFADKVALHLETLTDREAVRIVARALRVPSGRHEWNNNLHRSVLRAIKELATYGELADHLYKEEGRVAYYAWTCRLLADGNVLEAVGLLSLAQTYTDLHPADRAYCEAAQDAIVENALGEAGYHGVKPMLNASQNIMALFSSSVLSVEERTNISDFLSPASNDPSFLRMELQAHFEKNKGWKEDDVSASNLDAALSGDALAFLELAERLFAVNDLAGSLLGVKLSAFVAQYHECGAAKWLVRCVRANCALDVLAVDTSDPSGYDVPYLLPSDEETGKHTGHLSEGQIVVATNYPKATGSRHSDRYIALQNHEVLASPIDLQALKPGLDDLHAKLNLEFPWLSRVTDLVLHDLDLRQSYGKHVVQLPPLLLWGKPGTGKTRYCMRLAELLQLPFSALSFSGASDDRMLRGTGAGWGGAQPAFPVTKMAEARCANPLLLVDEIEKAAASDRRNGDPWSTLLMFLEPQNARQFFDECLMTSVNLSHINWIATANDVKSLPMPLLSRFSVVEIPSPQPEHVSAILSGVRHDFARSMGVDVRFVPELDYVEQAFLENAYRKHTNVRTVIRLMQKVLHRREKLLREMPN